VWHLIAGGLLAVFFRQLDVMRGEPGYVRSD